MTLLVILQSLVGSPVFAAEPPGATKAQPKMIELFVNEPWLTAIREGTKPVEGRTGPRSAFAGWIDREIRFYSNRQEVIVKVADIPHYDTLDDFLYGEGWQKAAPSLNSKKATVEAYLDFYPGDTIRQQGGMNGILVKAKRSRPLGTATSP
jgi:ASC-1-like (ASCH) protein